MASQFPRNAWYPLTWSRNVARDLGRHRILGEDLVVYRTQAGLPVAMSELCPHRLAPLSAGKLIGDSVQCGYHGMTFAQGRRLHPHSGPEIIPAMHASKPIRSPEDGLGLDLAGRSRFGRPCRDLRPCRNMPAPAGRAPKAMLWRSRRTISISPTISAIPHMSASCI